MLSAPTELTDRGTGAHRSFICLRSQRLPRPYIAIVQLVRARFCTFKTFDYFTACAATFGYDLIMLWVFAISLHLVLYDHIQHVQIG